MKRKSSENTPDVSAENPVTRPADAVPHVSIRTIYADAMREVMADPRRAIAEHDPWLAALLGYRPARATPEG